MPVSRGAAVRAVLALLLAAGLAVFVKFCVFEEGGVFQPERTAGELPEGIPETGDVPVTREACEAFLGSYDPMPPGFCIGIGYPRQAPFCKVGVNCQGLFNGVRKCNLVNRRSGGFTIPDREDFANFCGAECPHGEVARGNECVAPGGKEPQSSSPETPPETPPVPATVMFSAGANGTIAARVGSGVMIRGGAVEVGGKTVDIVFEAIPDAGYRVGSWADLGDAACGGESGGHGGPRSCAVRARNGGDYHVSVDFAAGALPADIPESGDVPARGVGGILSCAAFGGDFVPAIANDICRDFAGAGSHCVIEGGAGANCQAVFNAARDCNAGNKPAVAAGVSGGAAACGAACGAGRVAVGGACEDPGAGPFRAAFFPEARVRAFRIDGTPVVSGGRVSDNVVLSVVATPESGSFVAGWSGDCEVPAGKHGRAGVGDERADPAPVIQTEAPTGGFDDGGAKFCLARITMNTDVTADIQAKPPGAPDYPVFGSDLGAGGAAAAHQANCELFGGTYNGDKPAIVRCAGLDDNNAECLHVNSFGGATCGALFDAMRTCLNVNRPVKFLKPDAAGGPAGLRAECKDACPSGERARGTSCAPAAASEHVKESPKTKTPRAVTLWRHACLTTPVVNASLLQSPSEQTATTPKTDPVVIPEFSFRASGRKISGISAAKAGMTPHWRECEAPLRRTQRDGADETIGRILSHPLPRRSEGRGADFSAVHLKTALRRYNYDRLEACAGADCFLRR